MIDCNCKFLKCKKSTMKTLERFYYSREDPQDVFSSSDVTKFSKNNNGHRKLQPHVLCDIGVASKKCEFTNRTYYCEFTDEFHEYIKLSPESRKEIKSTLYQERTKNYYKKFIPVVIEAMENSYKGIDHIVSPRSLLLYIKEHKLMTINKNTLKYISTCLKYWFDAKPYSKTHRSKGNTYLLKNDIKTTIAMVKEQCQ